MLLLGDECVLTGGQNKGFHINDSLKSTVQEHLGDSVGDMSSS